MFFSDLLQSLCERSTGESLTTWKVVQKQFIAKSSIKVTDIQTNSKKVRKGSLFLGVQGNTTSGTKYVQDAIKQKASIILIDKACTEEFLQLAGDKVVILYVPNLKQYVSELLSVFYQAPEKLFFKIGVTGTNGKTTVAQMCTKLLSHNNRLVLSLGTIENKIVSKNKEMSSPASLTTPGPVELMEQMCLGRKKKCDTLVMEVSSHALSQDRVQGIQYDRTLFTNLTQDHLDYHNNMEEYYSAKKKLFSQYQKEDGVAIVNIDSDYGRRLLQELPHLNTLTYSIRQESSDVFLKSSSVTLEKTSFSVVYQSKKHFFESSLVGSVNLENLLAVVSLGFSLDLEAHVIAEAIQDIQVPGRNEKIVLHNKAVAIVDYAHTPDALERVITSIRELTSKKVICVFGCGGDRDTGKRLQMGAIASSLCDRVWITNDNPRTESPTQIINQILEGVPSEQKEKVSVCLDRKEAIQEALSFSQDSDCILVAGKGHEDYQIVGMEKQHFDDREVIRDWNRETSLVVEPTNKEALWN